MGSGSLGEREGGEPILTGCRVGGPLHSNSDPRETRFVCLHLTPIPVSPPPPQEYVAYSHTGRIIPAIWFRYDLSPITVKYTERRQPLYRFITTVSGWGACGGLLLLAPPPALENTGLSPQGSALRLYPGGLDPWDVQKCPQHHVKISGVSSGKYFPEGNAAQST